ncbi:MAG: hypothetical protein HC892_00110 [Saprospiraceae bacterium]|nr:hypothetical protein [Saprospiraceae bacterium]
MGADFERARNIPITSIMEAMGHTGKSSGGWVMYNCPLHQDDKPSFAVSQVTNRCTCFGGCGLEHSSSIDLVMALMGLSEKEAVEYLLNGKITPATGFKAGYKSIPSETAPLSKIDPTLKNPRLADQYFGARGITQEWRSALKFGTSVNFSQKWTDLGGTVHEWSTRRYTLPDFINGTVRQVEMRRDDADAMRYFNEELSEADRRLVTEAMQASGIDHVAEFLAGQRYLRWKSPHKPSIWGAWLLIGQDGRPKELPYIFITEGKICAASILSQGYPAIAHKTTFGVNLGAALRGVNNIFIVRDRGDARIADNTFSEIPTSGKTVMILDPLHGYGDSNDMVKDAKWRDFLQTFPMGQVISPIDNLIKEVW